MKLFKPYILIVLLALLNTPTSVAQTPTQLQAMTLNRDELTIAYISCQNIDSIPVIVINKCTEYLFSEEFAFFYQLNFESQIEDLKDGNFIEYSIIKINGYSVKEKTFALTPLAKYSEDLGMIFYAIVDQQYFE